MLKSPTGWKRKKKCRFSLWAWERIDIFYPVNRGETIYIFPVIPSSLFVRIFNRSLLPCYVFVTWWDYFLRYFDFQCYNLGIQLLEMGRAVMAEKFVGKALGLLKLGASEAFIGRWAEPMHKVW